MGSFTGSGLQIRMITRLFVVCCVVLAAGIGEAAELEFNRDIRPILSDNCFKCHGQDAKNQKSELRLDSFENATKDNDGTVGIVPGDLEKSPLHHKIHSKDGDEIMPPLKSKMSLTEKEKSTLDQWIKEGAVYQDHWALISIANEISQAKPKNTKWVRNEIDSFVLERLEEEKLSPAPEASKEKWLRRATFDLTGLPPTLEELDAFLADPDSNAFEKVVDRLFETDAYAERMAGEWLDVARYSDSYGFQVDRDRFVWPWRDWVIRAFKEGLSYDQFITWQLAGDLLPDASPDQILATTFNRLHPQKVEGGSVPEEFRVEYVSDRTHTFGTAFMGMTLECCRCHDHKYDPITTKEYYQLSSFFANIDESGLYSFFTASIPTPTLDLPAGTQEKDLAALEARVSAEEKKLDELSKSARPEFDKWILSGGAKTALPSGQVANFSFDTIDGKNLANTVKDGKPAITNANNKLVEGKNGKALLLTGDDPVDLPLGNFTRDDSFSIALWMQTPDVKERAVIFKRSQAWSDAASRGYELLLEEGKLSAALVHFWPGNAIRVRMKQALETKKWKHVTMTYDGSSQASGLSIYVDGMEAECEVVRNHLTREITGGGKKSDNIAIGQRMRDKGFKNGLVDEFQVYDRELVSAEVASLHSGSPLAKREAEQLFPFFLTNIHQPWKNQYTALKKARSERSELAKKIKQIMVMREQSKPRPAYILERGAYGSRGRSVSAGTPASFPSPPENAPANRLGLAQWLTASNHPLTARVTVNRYWQMLFGKGLVSTSEDFGNQGSPPTHPELLDWLARHFIDGGWDVRDLLKQMVLSATYRQSSTASPEAIKLDPENDLLARSPRFRLPAEMIRDNALAVSGLLVRKIGGAPVHPYDLAVSFKPSTPDKGEGLYRRSLYTYWKQTAPAPLMTTLDASKRDVCRVRRERNDSPLQGLVLLNSPQFVEAARVFAAKLIAKHGSNDDALIREVFRNLTSRVPSESEWPILRELLSEQQKLFQSSPENAAEYLKIGQSKDKTKTDPVRVASVAVLVTALMNFDECVTKR